MDRGMIRRIMLAALLARVAVFILAAGGMFMLGEGRTQADLAVNLLRGNGFMLSGEMLHPPGEAEAPEFFRKTFEFYRDVDGYYGVLRPDRPTLFLVPGYAFFMAGVFALFGEYNYLAVRGIQLLLGLVTVWIGIRLARRFLSGGYLYAAGLFFALDPFQLYFEAVPATQGIFTPLLLMGILLSLGAMDDGLTGSRRLRYAAAAGIAWAAAFYVRPVAIPLMVWVAVLMPLLPFIGRFTGARRGSVTFREGSLSALLMLGMFGLAMMPWGLRNRTVTGKFRIMPVQGGVNIWEYNGRIFTDHFKNEARGARLLYRDLRDEYMGRLKSPELAEFPSFRDEPEWVRDSVLYRRNVDFMLANPVLSLKLMFLRFVEFFKPFPLNEYDPLFTVAGILGISWVLVFLWGGAWICATRYGPEGFYLATAVAGYCLMHLLTASGTPHRVSIDFPMAILALLGVRYSVERMKAGRKIRGE